MTAVVYFVQAAAGGPIKIGVAAVLKERLQGLQNQCPVPLVCLATMPGYMKEEGALHERFADSRLHGEWFTDTPELQRFIASLDHPAPREAIWHGVPVGSAGVVASPSPSEVREREDDWRLRIGALRAEEKHVRGELGQLRAAIKQESREYNRVQRARGQQQRRCSDCDSSLASEDEDCWNCDYCKLCGMRLQCRGNSLCAGCYQEGMPLGPQAIALARRLNELAARFESKKVRTLADGAATLMRKQITHKRVIEALRLMTECVDEMWSAELREKI